MDSIFLLNYNNAIKALRTAESRDNYFNELQQSHTNMYARRTSIYTPINLSQELYNTYSEYLRNVISAINMLPPIKKALIILLDESADNGLPHTRSNNIVCLPEKILKLPVKQLQEIIFHEFVHIYQRENPIDIESFYNNGWKYIKSTMDTVEGDRINPDAMDIYTVNIDGELWMVRPRFLRNDAAKLTDIRMTYYNLKTGAVTVIMPAVIKQFFGDTISQSAFEHPNEMMAYMWSRLYFDRIAPITNAEYILKVWLDKYVYSK